MARDISITNDRDLAHWSREISRKKVDLTLPRIRVQDYYQRDPNRWMINTRVNRLKSQALQNYVEVEEVTTVGASSDRDSSDDDDYEFYSESGETFSKLNTHYSASTLLPNEGSNTQEDDNSEVQSYGSSATAGIIGAMLKAKQDDAQDRRLNDFEEVRASKMEKIDNPWKSSHDDDDSDGGHIHDYSSTVKVFSNDSQLSLDSDGNLKKKPLELKKKPPVAAKPRKQTHPDDVAEPGRRLPSVYFTKPRVKIFSSFPHCQQFWCRQGNPIPVPPPSKRNTFMNSNQLSLKHPLAHTFPFRVRTFRSNMQKFTAEELLFIIEGRSIFVTGEKRKEKKIIRTVTEEVCLPIDLDLNYLRVVRTAEGEIIFEELWEYPPN